MAPAANVEQLINDLRYWILWNDSNGHHLGLPILKKGEGDTTV